MNAFSGPSQLAPAPIYQGSKPVRNRLYLQFVKRFPCVCCGGSSRIDPAHTGQHALGQKASDMDVIPLCRKCHDEYDAGPSDFAIVHQLDIAELIQMFNHLWQLKLKRTA